MDIAQQLARLGVDIMEAGFPAASPGDLDAVRKIANTVGRQARRDREGNMTAPPIIAGLAHANKNDIDKAWEAVPRRGAAADSYLYWPPATFIWSTSSR